MDELMRLVYSAAGALLAVQMISALFPEKNSTWIKGLAVLSILCVLIRGAVRTEFELDMPTITPEHTLSNTFADAVYSKIGTELLQERLYALLDAAGIETLQKQDGIEIRYRMDDHGVIEIDGVYVWLVYAADRDRAFAVLQSVLTERIPIYLHTD